MPPAWLVDVEDERAGTVRIRRQVDKADEMELETRSTRTLRVRRDNADTHHPRSTRTVRVGAAESAMPPGASDEGTWGGAE